MSIYDLIIKLNEAYLDSGLLTEIDDWQYKEYASNAKSAGNYKEKMKWHQKAGMVAAQHDPKRAERHFAAVGAARMASKVAGSDEKNSPSMQRRLKRIKLKGAPQRKDDAGQLVKWASHRPAAAAASVAA